MQLFYIINHLLTKNRMQIENNEQNIIKTNHIVKNLKQTFNLLFFAYFFLFINSKCLHVPLPFFRQKIKRKKFVHTRTCTLHNEQDL